MQRERVKNLAVTGGWLRAKVEDPYDLEQLADIC